MTAVIYYFPNLLDYLRLILVVCVICNIKKCPLLAFLINLASGLCDNWDGILARTYNQRSKFGYAIDIGMDRITTMTLFFSCASVYPKYWFMFLILQFAEIFCDLIKLVVNLNSVFENLLILLLNSNQSEDYNQIRAALFQQAGIELSFKSNKTEIILDDDLKNEFKTNSILDVVSLIHLASDLFFWLAYYGAVLSKKPLIHEIDNALSSSLSRISIERNSSLKRSDSGSGLSSKSKCMLKFLRLLLCDFFEKFGEIGTFIEIKLISHFKILNFLRSKLKILFRILCLICITGASLKFYIHTSTSLVCLTEIIAYDEKFVKSLDQIQKTPFVFN